MFSYGIQYTYLTIPLNSSYRTRTVACAPLGQPYAHTGVPGAGPNNRHGAGGSFSHSCHILPFQPIL